MAELEYVSLDVDGVIYELHIDGETAEKLRSDASYAQLYGNMLTQIGQLSSAKKATTTEATTEATTAEASCATAKDVPSEAVSRCWTHELILLLIEERRKRSDKFDFSTIRKKKLWDEISVAITTITGVKIKSDECDRKWRSLMQRYRIIKDKNNSTGNPNNTWEFFDILDSFLGCKITSCPPAMRVLGSLQQKPTSPPEQTTAPPPTTPPPTANLTSSSSSPTPSTSTSTDTPNTSTANPYSAMKRKLTQAAIQNKKKSQQPPDWFLKFQKEKNEKRLVEAEELKIFRERVASAEEKKTDEIRQIKELLAELVHRK